MAHAVHARHVDTIRNRMTALDGLPRFVLRQTELVLLCGMPADSSRVKQHLSALQG